MKTNQIESKETARAFPPFPLGIPTREGFFNGGVIYQDYENGKKLKKGEIPEDVFHCEWWGKCRGIIDDLVDDKETLEKEVVEKNKEIEKLKTCILTNA